MRLLLYILMLSVLFVRAIPPNWVNPKGGQEHTFNISLKGIFVNGQAHTLQPRDAIAIFETARSEERCVGYAYIDSNTVDSLLLYARTDSALPFWQGSTYVFKLWKGSKDCQTIFTDTISNKSLVNGMFTQVKYLSATFITVDYPERVTTEVSQVVPVISNANVTITFSFTDTLLKMNTKTGVLYPNLTKPGTYAIYTYSPTCLAQNSDTIEIALFTLGPLVDTLRFDTKQVDCYQKGYVKVLNDFSGLPELKLRLFNKLSPQDTLKPNAAGSFEGLDVGTYVLRIEMYQNLSYYPVEFHVTSVCSNSVLDMTNPNNQQTLFIQKHGTAKIYNREGVLIKTLSVPGTWDGTDNSGSPMPMGDYFIFINDQKQQVVTIFR